MISFRIQTLLVGLWLDYRILWASLIYVTHPQQSSSHCSFNPINNSNYYLHYYKPLQCYDGDSTAAWISLHLFPHCCQLSSCPPPTAANKFSSIGKLEMTSLLFQRSESSKFQRMFSNEDAETCQSPQVSPLRNNMSTAQGCLWCCSGSMWKNCFVREDAPSERSVPEYCLCGNEPWCIKYKNKRSS